MYYLKAKSYQLIILSNYLAGPCKISKDKEAGRGGGKQKSNSVTSRNSKNENRFSLSDVVLLILLIL